MKTKSILTEARQIERAVTLIKLGARLQVVSRRPISNTSDCCACTAEVAGKSPSKGQLPFSTDWFMTAAQHPSRVAVPGTPTNTRNKVAELGEIDTVIKTYQLYLEQTQAQNLEPLLSITRAGGW